MKTYDCGIDLGTTNSCISIANGDGTCKIIKNLSDQRETTPSAVCISKNGQRMIVGQRAYNRSVTGDVVTQFKREMGTNKEYVFPASGIIKTPIELSAEILKSMKNDAEKMLGREMKDVVITVPAAFEASQTDATNKAAEMAGFRSCFLLQEPIAAAFCYSVTEDASDGNWLVFDFGGGTLDVAIVKTDGKRLDVIDHAGDNFLGGKDIDMAVYEKLILPALQEEYSFDSVMEEGTRRRILLEIETLKEELCSGISGEAEIGIFDVYDNNDQEVSFTRTVKLEEFEEAILPVVNRAVEIARKVVDKAQYSDDAFRKLVLVGGSTLIPLVRKRLNETFSIEQDASHNPITIVSEGAALYAETQEAEYDDAASVVTDDTSYTVKVKHDATTASDTLPVMGVIDATGKTPIAKIRIEGFADEKARGALWDSAWITLPEGKGFFETDVRIINREGSNYYRISVEGEDGKAKKIAGEDTFKIVHYSSALKPEKPPFPTSVGIMVEKDGFNIVDWIIEKNTKLPIKSTRTYLLNKTVSKGTDDSFEIRFLEGEYTYNPDANGEFRRIHIYGKDLKRSLTQGTEIEITISIDESRRVSISGYIPMYEYELVGDNFSRSEESYVDYAKQMDYLEERKFQEVRKSLTSLQKSGINMDDEIDKLDDIIGQFDTMYEKINVQNDEVHQYLRGFYDLQNGILEKERAEKKNKEQKEETEDIAWYQEKIRQYGTQREVNEFEATRTKMEEAEDETSRQYYMSELRKMNNENYANSFERLKQNYYSRYEGGIYTDETQGNYWKEKAQEAINKENKKGLREALDKLYQLEVKNVSEAETIVYADLKKV